MTKDRLIYLPLGGAGEIGMNLYVYGYGPKDKERLIIVDLGVAFPDMDTTPGVDLIFPDVAWLTDRRNHIEAIFITQRVPKNHYLETALSIINKQTKQFCVNENANCFKLDENLILEINVDLYDAFHTRPTGNKKISDYIFSEIIKKL